MQSSRHILSTFTMQPLSPQAPCISQYPSLRSISMYISSQQVFEQIYNSQHFNCLSTYYQSTTTTVTTTTTTTTTIIKNNNNRNSNNNNNQQQQHQQQQQSRKFLQSVPRCHVMHPLRTHTSHKPPRVCIELQGQQVPRTLCFLKNFECIHFARISNTKYL